MLLNFTTSFFYSQAIRNPKTLIPNLTIVFKVLCFLLAIYMSVVIVGRYIEDLSKTSITYKHYNEKQEDQYPTYSICFKGNHFYWNNELAIFNEYELHSREYEQMLKGENTFRYEYNVTSRLYEKVPTFYRNVTSTIFDSFYLKFSDILDEAHFTADDSKYSVSYEKVSTTNSSDEPPFYIGYQSPEMFCFSRESKYGPNTIWLEDVLVFNETLLNYINIVEPSSNISLYIHYPNHLIRSLATPNFKLSLQRYKDLITTGEERGKFLEFSLAQGTVLRKRPDSRGSCTMEIDNYDQYLQEVLCSKTNIRCIPPYWKNRLQNITRLPECTKEKQLEAIYNSITNYKEIIANHSTPCTEMYNSIVSKWKRKSGGGSWMLVKFLYEDQYYIEIKYWQDFGLESFISNLGGFIGIFLGYSMMQLPELIGKVSLSIRLLSVQLILLYYIY